MISSLVQLVREFPDHIEDNADIWHFGGGSCTKFNTTAGFDNPPLYSSTLRQFKIALKVIHTGQS